MRHLIGTSLAFLLLACGSGGSSGDGGTLGPESVLDYCTAYGNAFAQRYASCVNGSPALILAHDDPAVLCPQAAKAVTAGRAVYDRTRAGACLDFLQTGDCYAIEALFNHNLDQPDCAGAIAGKLGTMAQCYTDWDCQSGWCSNNQCPSVCVPRAGPGASCSPVQCKDGYNCSGGVCVSLFGQGTHCAIDIDCQLGLYCAPGTGAAGSTCQPRIPVGEACTDSGCVIGAICDGSQCQTQFGPGESCDANPYLCGPGLYCSSASSTCVVGPGPNQSCQPAASSEHIYCLIGYCDDANTYTCIAPSVGSSCAGNWNCGSSLTCLAGTCVAACTEP